MELAKGKEIDKSTRLTKYTHGEINSDGTKKGWALQGKLRFNNIFDATKKERDKRNSKQMDARIQKIWYDANPSNRRIANREEDGDPEAAKQLEMQEAQYVPKTDFDLET